MAQTENVQFALVTLIYIWVSQWFLNVHMFPRVLKHSQEAVSPYHSDGANPRWSRNKVKTGFLQGQTFYCYTRKFETWKKETGISLQQTTGSTWRLIIALVNPCSIHSKSHCSDSALLCKLHNLQPENHKKLQRHSLSKPWNASA